MLGLSDGFADFLFADPSPFDMLIANVTHITTLARSHPEERLFMLIPGKVSDNPCNIPGTARDVPENTAEEKRFLEIVVTTLPQPKVFGNFAHPHPWIRREDRRPRHRGIDAVVEIQGAQIGRDVAEWYCEN